MWERGAPKTQSETFFDGNARAEGQRHALDRDLSRCHFAEEFGLWGAKLIIGADVLFMVTTPGPLCRLSSQTD